MLQLRRPLVLLGALVLLLVYLAYPAVKLRLQHWQLNFAGGYTGSVPDCAFRSSLPNAYATLVTSDEYLSGLESLECTLRRQNVTEALVVLVHLEKLSAANKKLLTSGERAGRWILLLLERSITFPNNKYARFSEAWNKLQIWTLEEYGSVIFLDADVLVQRSASQLFALASAAPIACGPAAYRLTLDYPAAGYCLSGLLVVRPCRETFEHMLSLASQNVDLQFRQGWAEQDFLDWYFRYRRLMLPYVTHGVWQHLRGTALLEETWLLHVNDPKLWSSEGAQDRLVLAQRFPGCLG
jgi:glycogenin glucosyltransferase